MKSGVYYLYEYKNNQKSRNVGFLKISQQAATCSLQICARGIPVFQKDSVDLSVLYGSENNLLALRACPVACENHAISCKMAIPVPPVENAPLTEEICGFLLKLPDNTYIVASDVEIHFPIRDYVQPAPIPEQISPSIEVNTADSTAPVAPATETPSNISAKCTEPLADSSPKSEFSVRKIHRSELSLLPRKYWHLANNNFLIHGYYNYNHLLLVEENDHLLLGVPGIYDKREARAADSFGFPVFSESYTKFLSLSSDETNPHGTFGYWCKKIPLTADTSKNNSFHVHSQNK